MLTWDFLPKQKWISLYPNEIKAYLERGSKLAWGIVPTNFSSQQAKEIAKTMTFDSLREKLETLITLFVSKGINEKMIRDQMIITPSCGMGTLTVEETEKILGILQEFNQKY
jgi:hypothetical protein